MTDPHGGSLRSWGAKGIWAVSDQALFAGSNFVLNILLARWLTPQDYGAFALAFSVFLLLGTLHTALLTEPMLVFGAGRFRGNPASYLKVVVRGHCVVSGMAAAILLAGAALGTPMGLQPSVVRVLVALALATPFILSIWLMRRACYMVLKPRLAVVASAFYLVVLLTCIAALTVLGLLSAVWAFASLALASSSTSLWLMRRLDAVPHLNRRLDAEIARIHWKYGKWALPSGALSWIPGNIFLIALSVWASLESAATLRAAYNLVLPGLHVVSALAVLILPTLARARLNGNMRRTALGALSLFMVGGALYWLVVVLFGQVGAAVLYGEGYSFSTMLLVIMGAMPVSVGMVAVLGGVLRARERPDEVFFAYIGATLFAVTFGLGLTAGGGVVGAAAAGLLSSVVTALAMTWILWRRGGLARPATGVTTQPGSADPPTRS